MTKHRKKKRKISIKAILIILIAALLIVLGISAGLALKIRENHIAYIEKTIEQRKAYIDTIENTQKPSHLSDDLYNQVKKMAEDYGKKDYDKLEKFEDKEVGKYYELAQKTNKKYRTIQQEYINLFNNISQIDDDIYLKFLIKDDDRLKFISDYYKRASLNNPPATLSESLDEVPALIQWDERWGYVPYGDWYIAFAGCGPTSISMIASYLNQDPSITPVTVAQKAMELDQYENGAGTKWSFYSTMADEYGISHSEQYDPAAEEIVESLKNGNLVILSMEPGIFTETGHFIVLTGHDKDGKVTIHDPNSIKNTKKTWDPNLLADQSISMWSFWKD